MTYITPQFNKWLKTRMPIRPELRLEFSDRLDNLCEYTHPMTPALREEVVRHFGFDMLRVIEQYSTFDPPRLNDGQIKSFIKVFPKEFELEAERLFTRVCSVPPPVLRFYYVDLVPTEPIVDILLAGDYGGTGILTGDGVGLATWVQGAVTGESGAWGIETYTMWIAIEGAAPDNWTWNGNPVVFNEVGEVSQECYTTGDFGFSVAYPDSTDWYLLFIYLQFGGVVEYGGGLMYNDPDFATKFQTFITQISGANSVATAVIEIDRVSLTVSDTYLVFSDVRSYDPDVNEQINPFALCP